MHDVNKISRQNTARIEMRTFLLAFAAILAVSSAQDYVSAGKALNYGTELFMDFVEKCKIS